MYSDTWSPEFAAAAAAAADAGMLYDDSKINYNGLNQRYPTIQ